jgi:Type II restriction endonuclease EcoO109I
MVMSNNSSSPTTPQNQLLLEKASRWFAEDLIHKHLKNIKKLKRPSEFKINPFTVAHLAQLVEGEVTPLGIAKALVYPRALGTSINTSFGQNLQAFITEVFENARGSLGSGMDIEFIDALDGRKKYAQLKAGPNTINKDDVITIDGHFKGIRNLAKTNQLKFEPNDLVIGILYGEEKGVSAHYKKLRDKHYYTLYVGKEFWYRLTGDEAFLDKLVLAITSNIETLNQETVLQEVIEGLAKTQTIIDLANSVTQTQRMVKAKL